MSVLSLWRLIFVTWLLFLRWLDVLLVCTMVTTSTTLRLRLRWLVTTWASSLLLILLWSITALVLVRLTVLSSFLWSKKEVIDWRKWYKCVFVFKMLLVWWVLLLYYIQQPYLPSWNKRVFEFLLGSDQRASFQFETLFLSKNPCCHIQLYGCSVTELLH